MQSSQIPVKIQLPFGNNAGGAYIRTIPVPSQIGINNGEASYNDGFPPLCFSPDAAGGINPDGRDFNGILRDLSALLWWYSAGAPVSYDATFQTAIGGYPKGAIIQSGNTAGLFFESLIENNFVDPDLVSAGWSVFSSVSITTLSSSSTPDIWTATGDTINYTGTAIATGFATAPVAGARKRLICSGACSFVTSVNMYIEGCVVGSTIYMAAGAIVDVEALTTTIFKMTYNLSGSFTITGTGFASPPTGTVTYSVTNGVCTLHIPFLTITGASNANTLTLTGLPSAISPSDTKILPVLWGVDAGSPVTVYASISGSGTVITLQKAGIVNNWTTSGTKQLNTTELTYSL